MDVSRKVRHEIPTLQSALHADIVMARHGGRTAGRRRMEVELNRPLQATVSLGEDDAAAAAASTTLAGAWGAAALAMLASEATPRELATLTAVLDGRVRRTAATETARAFNDEREALIEQIHLALGGFGGHHDTSRGEPAPGVFKIWSAILDARTCAFCFGADGEVVEANRGFKAGTIPAHPNCRCVVEHLIVAKRERLEDIAIDYDLFKQELRDVIREKRAISDRHAQRFASESLGGKRSPVTLTKRFTREDHVTRH